MNYDLVNGLFEFFGGIWLWLDVLKLYKDRDIKGVYWPTRGFFAAWGIWNLFYYPSLDQWWSFAGGLWIVAANLVWVVLAIMYLRSKV
jgi:hypothetical protein